MNITNKEAEKLYCPFKENTHCIHLHCMGWESYKWKKNSTGGYISLLKNEIPNEGFCKLCKEEKEPTVYYQK